LLLTYFIANPNPLFGVNEKTLCTQITI